MVLAGETEVSSAGVQLARDNRPEVQRHNDLGMVIDHRPHPSLNMAEILFMP